MTGGLLQLVCGFAKFNAPANPLRSITHGFMLLTLKDLARDDLVFPRNDYHQKPQEAHNEVSPAGLSKKKMRKQR